MLVLISKFMAPWLLFWNNSKCLHNEEKNSFRKTIPVFGYKPDFFELKSIQKHLKQSLITKEFRFTFKSRMKQRERVLFLRTSVSVSTNHSCCVLKTESNFRQKHSSRSVTSFAKCAWYRYSRWFSLGLEVLKLKKLLADEPMNSKTVVLNHFS